MDSPRTYTISELAREFGVTTRTIRFYEEKGLLEPSRDGQHRIYRKSDRARLELILRGKRAGMSLEESREVIEMYNPEGDNYEQYQFMLNKVDKRQAQLEAQMKDIQQIIAGLEEVRERCTQAMAEITAGQAADK